MNYDVMLIWDLCHTLRPPCAVSHMYRSASVLKITVFYFVARVVYKRLKFQGQCDSLCECTEMLIKMLVLVFYGVNRTSQPCVCESVAWSCTFSSLKASLF